MSLPNLLETDDAEAYVTYSKLHGYKVEEVKAGKIRARYEELESQKSRVGDKRVLELAIVSSPVQKRHYLVYSLVEDISLDNDYWKNEVLLKKASFEENLIGEGWKRTHYRTYKSAEKQMRKKKIIKDKSQSVEETRVIDYVDRFLLIYLYKKDLGL
ncbi:MAG: hypothetical protein Q7S56_00475 [Nanoarchaeota archaeon]|nr:hypothetical protein [Nanoarchaeota archaeon]